MALYRIEDIKVTYNDESGTRITLTDDVTADGDLDKIKTFLSTFAGAGEEDLEYGLADLDLDDREGMSRMKNLKYMRQLVCRITLVSVYD